MHHSFLSEEATHSSPSAPFSLDDLALWGNARYVEKSSMNLESTRTSTKEGANSFVYTEDSSLHTEDSSVHTEDSSLCTDHRVKHSSTLDTNVSKKTLEPSDTLGSEHCNRDTNVPKKTLEPSDTLGSEHCNRDNVPNKTLEPSDTLGSEHCNRPRCTQSITASMEKSRSLDHGAKPSEERDAATPLCIKRFYSLSRLGDA